jgi:hypothetical protein
MNCKVKKTFLLLFFCGFHQLLLAQPLTFNDKGGLTSVPPKKITSLADVKVNDSTPKANLTALEQAAFKKEILRLVQQTLNNLDDDSLFLKEYYTLIWDVATFDKLRTELMALKNYLKNNIPTGVHTLVPSSADIIATIATTPIITAAALVQTDDTVVVTVTATDVLKQFIFTRYNNTLSGFSRDLDMTYINGWRQIETAHRLALTYIDSLTGMKKNETGCDNAWLTEKERFAQTQNGNIASNNVRQLLNSHLFFKQWLWFTGGFPYINPLPATTPDRLYPGTEPNTLLTNALKEKQDLLQQSSVLNEFKTTGYTVNRVLLPITKGNNYLLHHDYLKNYKDNKNSLSHSLTNKESITILTHNLPAALQVKAISADSTIRNKSDPEIALGEGITSLAKFITDLSPAAGIWTSIISKVFNKQLPTIPSATIAVPNIEALTKKQKTTFFSDITNKALANEFSISDSSIMPLSRTFMSVEKEEKAKIEKIRVGVTEVPITYEVEKDKQGILMAYLKKAMNANCEDSCDKKAKVFITAFLAETDCYTLDYTDTKTLKTDATILIERFVCYIKSMLKCKEQAERTLFALRKLVSSLKPYINILYRSFPPVDLTATIDPTPQRRSVISNLDIASSEVKTAKQVIITLLENKTTDPADKAGTPVAKTKFKVGKLQYFSLSAGLAFTAAPYTVATVSKTTGLPEVNRGERFKLLAALHYYPWGLFSLDNRLAHNHLHRVSVFVGLGIPKPLENYYGGLGYDLVPGIKLLVGYHLYKQTKFTVLNNQIIDKIAAPKGAGAFIGLNFSPEIVTNLINIFKKP